MNQTGYGLTCGLESLDDRERDYWKEHIRAGNLYINRVTTGAIVLRQPFGGMGKSGFGPGIKAGGPNYVAQFMDFDDVATVPAGGTPQSPGLAALCRALAARPQPDDARIVAAALSYEHSQREEFGVEHDHFRLVGQDNVRRYLPVGSVRVRVHPDDTRLRRVRARLRSAGRRLPRRRQHAARARCAGRATARGTHRVLGGRDRVRRGIRRAARRGHPAAARSTASATRRPDRAALEVLQAGNAANGCVVERARVRRRPARAAVVPARAEHQHRLPPLRQPRHCAPTRRGRKCLDATSRREHDPGHALHRRGRDARPRTARARRRDRRKARLRTAADAHSRSAGGCSTSRPRATASLRDLQRPVRFAKLLAALGPTYIKLGQILSMRKDIFCAGLDRGARDAAGRRTAPDVRRDARAGRGQPRRHARGPLRLVRRGSRSARPPSRRRIARAPRTATTWS